MAYPVSQGDAPEEDAATPMASEGAYSEYPENFSEPNPAEQTGDVSDIPSGQSIEPSASEQISDAEEAAPTAPNNGIPEATATPLSGNKETPEQHIGSGEDAASEPHQLGAGGNAAVEPQQTEESEE